MNQLNLKIFIFGLIGVLLMTSPAFLLAQSAVAGQLVVTGNTAKTTGNFASVNGENALSGRTVMSPAKIVTSPDANAKVILTKLGSTILFAPGSTMNLTFDNTNIGGTISAGTVTVQNIGQTKVNITTSGGAVIFSNQPSSVQISVTNGATQVCVIDGEAVYNNTRIAAGQNSCGSQPVGNAANTAAQPGGAAGSPNYLLFGIIGAAVAAVVIGIAVSNGGDNSTPVSPTR